MQSRFRKLSCTAVGGADAERFSIGAEEVNYEGPLQLRLQVCVFQTGDGSHQSHGRSSGNPVASALNSHWPGNSGVQNCDRLAVAISEHATRFSLQVPTPIVEGDGAFSFHIPLPNPKGPIRAFLDRVREVLSSPLPPHYAPHLNALMPGALHFRGM